MPSSTSSSEVSAFSVYVRLLLVVVAALAAVRVLVSYLELNHRGALRGSDPVGAAVAQLDDVALEVASSRNVVMFGSSRIMRGFDHVAYERAVHRACGAKVKVWNFGFGFIGVTPLTQSAIADRMGEAFSRAGARWDLAIVEVAPFQLTHRVSTGEYGAGQDEWLSRFRTPSELLIGMSRDFGRSLRVLSYRGVYGGSNPHRLTGLYRDLLFPAQPAPLAPDEAARQRQAGELFMRLGRAEPRLQYVPGWSARRRGATWSMSMTDLSTRAVALFDQIDDVLKPGRAKTMEDTRKWRIDCCDAYALNFDPQQIEALHRLVARMQSMSERLVLFMPPENRTWMPVSPEGEARTRALLERFSHPLVDLSVDPRFSADDFTDTTHLDRFGAARMSRLLGERTADQLCGKGGGHPGRP